MSEEFKKTVADIRFAMQVWKWPSFLKRLRETDPLVMDDDVYYVLSSLYKGFKALHLSPEEALNDITAASKRAFVFTRHNEKHLVRALRAKYPNRRIISMTYEMGVSSAEPPARIPRPIEKSGAMPPPTVVFSSPGSDTEYLAQMMELNGLGKPREYLGQALLHLVPAVQGFSPLRFLEQVYAQADPEEGLSLSVQSDVWELLQEHTTLKHDRIKRMLEASDAKVVYFSRRDKMMQAALLTLMDGRPSRSVWNMVKVERQHFKPRDIDFLTANKWMQWILDAEARLEDFVTSLPKVKMITLEELVSNPKAVLQSLAMYLEKPVPGQVGTIDYAKYYGDMEGLADQTLSFRLELIDRLGLHVNSSGSWTTGTDDLLRGNGKKADPLIPEFVERRS